MASWVAQGAPRLHEQLMTTAAAFPKGAPQLDKLRYLFGHAAPLMLHRLLLGGDWVLALVLCALGAGAGAIMTLAVHYPHGTALCTREWLLLLCRLQPACYMLLQLLVVLPAQCAGGGPGGGLVEAAAARQMAVWLQQFSAIAATMLLPFDCLLFATPLDMQLLAGSAVWAANVGVSIAADALFCPAAGAGPRAAAEGWPLPLHGWYVLSLLSLAAAWALQHSKEQRWRKDFLAAHTRRVQQLAALCGARCQQGGEAAGCAGHGHAVAAAQEKAVRMQDGRLGGLGTPPQEQEGALAVVLRRRRRSGGSQLAASRRRRSATAGRAAAAAARSGEPLAAAAAAGEATASCQLDDIPISALLYESPLETAVFGIKVEHGHSQAGEGQGSTLAVASASLLPAPGNPSAAIAGFGAMRLPAFTAQLPAGYADAAAAVRGMVDAALVMAVQQAGLQLVRASITAFPGCVHAILSLMLPASQQGRARVRRASNELLHQLIVAPAAAPAEAAAVPAAAAGLYLEPVALPVPAAASEAAGAAAGVAAWSGRGTLVLPPGLLAQLGGAGAGGAAPGRLAALRLVVVEEGSTVPLADERWEAAQVPTSRRLGLQLRAAHEPGTPLLQAVVLAALPGQGEEALLAQLPLLVLPAAACEDMRAVFAKMVAQVGGIPAAAFCQHFAPLARDYACLLQAGGAPHVLLAGLAAGVEACLTACSNSSGGAGSAALQLLRSRRAAAAPAGWPAVAHEPPAAAVAAPAGATAAASATAAAPLAAGGLARTLRTRAQPAALAFSRTAHQQQQQRASGADGSSGGPAKSGGPPAGDSGPPRSPRLQRRDVLLGFDEQLESQYAASKAQQLAPLDYVAVGVRIAFSAAIMWLVTPMAQQPAQRPLLVVLLAVLGVSNLPYAVLLAAPAFFRRRRNALLAGSRMAVGLLAPVSCVTAAWRLMAAELMPHVLPTCALPALVWCYALAPALMRLTMRAQLVSSVFNMAHGYTLLYHMNPASPNAVSPSALLLRVAGFEAVAWCITWALEACMRRRFLRSRQGSY